MTVTVPLSLLDCVDLICHSLYILGLVGRYMFHPRVISDVLPPLERCCVLYSAVRDIHDPVRNRKVESANEPEDLMYKAHSFIVTMAGKDEWTGAIVAGMDASSWLFIKKISGCFNSPRPIGWMETFNIT